MTVACWYPAQEDSYTGILPEGFDEWQPASGQCEHEWCIEGHRIGRLFAASPRITREELAEMNADLELVMDETHGRGF